MTVMIVGKNRFEEVEKSVAIDDGYEPIDRMDEEGREVYLSPMCKCISSWQPWASLLVHGWKKIETRHWVTRYRGPLLIHAAKRWDRKQIEICNSEPFAKCIEEIGDELPRGCIVGAVWLGDILRSELVKLELEVRVHTGRREIAFGNYEDNRWCWITTKRLAFDKPLNRRGFQGMYNFKINETRSG